MAKRLRTLGIVLSVIGLLFVVGGGVAYSQVQDGYGSLQSFSEAQNVQLNYNEDGQLIDRGTTEGADAIMVLLTEDWGYPVNEADLDPNDPLVNTASEYMYQMATIAFHTLNGTQVVVLAEDVEYNGETFTAGSYDVAVEGRYWTDFDRMHPLEGPARGQAWSGTAHGLIAELGVGTVTHSALQLGLAIAGTLAAIGLTAIVAGLGLVWATKEEKATKPQPPATEPDAKKELEPIG
jgi:hypothetical protein